MLPPAPALFSTMTCWPHSSERRAAAMRAAESAPPPGGKPTMIRTTRVGQAAVDCANVNREKAGAAKAAAPRRRKLRRGNFMFVPPQYFLIHEFCQSRHAQALDVEVLGDGAGLLLHLDQIAQFCA